MQAFLKHKFSKIAKALMKVKVIIDKNFMKKTNRRDWMGSSTRLANSFV